MKALFIGLGGIGQRHLRILKSIYPNIKVAAVRVRGNVFEINDDLKINKKLNIIEKFNITNFSSISEALDFNPDFAIVANPTSMHVSTTTELIKNKIPVLLEKPISNNIIGVKNLLKISKKNKVPVMIGYMMRFNPCVIKLKEYIDNNLLGRLYSIIVTINSYMPNWHKYEKYNSFYAGQKKLGGGVVLTEIHELDLLNWFFGKPKKISAIGGKLSNLNLDVEDTVSILMEHKINNRPIPANLNMSFVQKAPIRKFLILGEFGSIEWDIIKNTLRLDNYQKKIHREHKYPKFLRNDMFKKQMEHFINSIKNKKKPITSLDRVIDGHLTALVIKKAIQVDKFIKVKQKFKNI